MDHVKARVKNIVKRLLPRPVAAVREFHWNSVHRRGIASYGQEGEDRVLASLLFRAHGGRNPPGGFYVDVGAHDPFRFSNTYFFYKLGWSGINIDAAPGSMRSFVKHRARDINLEVGIGLEKSESTFYVFNEAALNTFDREMAMSRSVPPWKVIAEVQVQSEPLGDVLAKHVPANRRIDFMTIDVEGRDVDVLRSNDWTRFRPMIMVVEIFGKAVASASDDPVARFLAERGYAFYAKTVNTAMFVDLQFLPFAGIGAASGNLSK